MAFISREVFRRYLLADAHRLFGDNGWAVDVFYFVFITVLSYTIMFILSISNTNIIALRIYKYNSLYVFYLLIVPIDYHKLIFYNDIIIIEGVKHYVR